ncbi:MAG: hypothetical protein ACX930_10575 [Erythrobacter sp.]
MSDSNWNVRIAVIGCLAAILLIFWGLSVSIYATGFSSGIHQTEANGYAAEYSSDTDERINKCPTDTVAALRECVEEAVTASHESQRAEYDLNAQRNMAEWAWWLLIVSTVGIGVTTIGTIFLAIQVQLTREAVKDTSDATKAMNRQNELTEQAQRPWLSIELETRTPYFVNDQVFQTTLGLKIKNVGTSPATNVKVISKCFVNRDADNEINEFLASLVERRPEREWGDTLVPNQVIMRVEPVRLNPSEHPTVEIAGRKTLTPIVVVAVTYVPPHSERRFQTSVGFIMGKIRDGALSVIVIDEGDLPLDRSGIANHPIGGRIS